MKRKSTCMKVKNVFRSNKGMTMVTVIVAIGFVAALVSILLMTTLVNFKMKAVNQRGKDSFYSAEQVLDEINVGLQRIVSESLSSTYVEIMESNSTMSNDEKMEKLKTEYYERVWAELEADGLGHQYYSVDKLEAMLKQSTRWHTPTGPDEFTQDGSGYGAIITAVCVDTDGNSSEEKYGNMISYTSGGIVLKDVKVYYKDAKGFVSIVQTDIKLSYPNFSFAKNSALTDITEYTFIADAGTIFDNSADVTIDGNIYTNNLKGKKNNDIKFGDERTAIIKYNLDLDGGSFESGTGDSLWARNILLKSSTIDYNGECYLANDMNLMGKNSQAKFKGTYIGYGNSTTDADDSSAILVNGVDTKLDMKNLSTFNLFGHSFVGTGSLGKTNNKADDVLTARERAAKNYQRIAAVLGLDSKPIDEYKNVYMGESVAIKTDQMYYLVPAEAIGINEKDGKTICINQNNPLSKEDHDRIEEAIKTGKLGNQEVDVSFVSDQVPISGLGGISLNGFIAHKNGKPKYYEHQVRVDDKNTLYYYYMVFEPTYYMGDGTEATESQIARKLYKSDDKGESKANAYFATFYSANKEYADKYNKYYLDSATYGNTDDFVTAGSAYATSYDENNKKVFVRKAATQTNSSDTLESRKEQYTSEFMGRCWNLSTSTNKTATTYTSLEAEEEAGAAAAKNCQVVFENIVGAEKVVTDYVTGCTGEAYKESEDDTLECNKTGMKVTFTSEITPDPSKPGDKVKNGAIVSKENVTYGASEKNAGIHLIITTGDVAVNADFEGLIICDGELKVGTSVKMSAAPEYVSQALLYGYKVEKDGEELGITIASIMGENGADFIYNKVSDKDKLSKRMIANLITYENWKKE